MKAVTALLCCLFLVSVSGLPKPAPAQRQGEVFSALGQMPPVGGSVMVGPGATANITIFIESYSTDEEARSMAARFAKGAHQALRSALEKASLKGRIAFAGRNGYYELKLIRSKTNETGRQIFAVGGRAISFLDGYYPGTSHLDEFGILQLDLSTSNGVEGGSGTLVRAARIKTLDADRIDLDDHGLEPVRLKDVQKTMH